MGKIIIITRHDLVASNEEVFRPIDPKIPNYVIHDLDYDIVRSKSSRGIILLL